MLRKIGEAETLADGGIHGLLITSPITAPAAIERLVKLVQRSPDVMIVVDHPVVASKINAALLHAGAKLDVLIDIDPGIARTGVARPEAALALAKTIQEASQLNLRGVQFYCGIQQHMTAYADRHQAIVERTAYLTAIVDDLRATGFEVDIISGSGTGTFHIDLELGVFSELQAGSYVFMDQQYLECDLTPSGHQPFASSLFVDARVVSANHTGLVTLDAGFKALSTDGGTPLVASGAPSDARVVFMGDEHSALIASGIEQALAPGERVTLTVPHCDPTVNLYETYHVVKDGTLFDLWPVSARGRSR